MPLTDDLDIVRQVLAPDPPPAGVRRHGRDRLAAVIAAEGRVTGLPGGSGQPLRGSGGRRRRRALLAGGGLAVTAGAAAVAVAVATAGGEAGRGRASAMVLTAATIRQVATASRVALADSGQVQVSHRNTDNGALTHYTSYGTETFAFDGENWNDVKRETVLSDVSLIAIKPINPSRPINQTVITRLVGGKLYMNYVSPRYWPRVAWRRWYRETGAPTQFPSSHIPDPRTVLGVLDPTARFVVAGHQVIDGARLTVLRATQVRHLTAIYGLPDIPEGELLRSLHVWVDGHHVVRRIRATFRHVLQLPVKAARKHQLRARVARLASGRLLIQVADEAALQRVQAMLRAREAELKQHKVAFLQPIVRVNAHVPPAPPEVMATVLTVTFSRIGQPQVITAPRHAIPEPVFRG